MGNIFVEHTFFRHIEADKQYLSSQLSKILKDPGRHLDHTETQILQANFKSKIGAIWVDGRKIVIKRHNYKSNWHKFKRLFRKTRASRSWKYSRLLKGNDILVPPPVGFVETRIGPLRLESYYLYEHVDGIRGDAYFHRYRHEPGRIEKAMASIVDLVVRIRALGLIHGDVRVANLIFSDDRIWLLDFDDMRPIRWYKPARVRQRDIRGLRKDIGYNIPDAIQKDFYRRLDELEMEAPLTKRLRPRLPPGK